MQNSASNKIQIPLAGPLNLSANKIQTTDYMGYNNNNGAIYKNTLHPYYKGVHEGQYYKDADGNEYLLNSSGEFYINGTLNKTFSTAYTAELDKVDVSQMGNVMFYNETSDGLHNAYIVESPTSSITREYKGYVDGHLVNTWTQQEQFNTRFIITNNADTSGNVYFLLGVSKGTDVYYVIYDVTNTHTSNIAFFDIGNDSSNTSPLTQSLYYKDGFILFAISNMINARTTNIYAPRLYNVSTYAIIDTAQPSTGFSSLIGGQDSQGHILAVDSSDILTQCTISQITATTITVAQVSGASAKFKYNYSTLFYNKGCVSSIICDFKGTSFYNSTYDSDITGIYFYSFNPSGTQEYFTEDLYDIIENYYYSSFINNMASCPNSFSIQPTVSMGDIYCNMKYGYITSWAINGVLIQNYDTFDDSWDVQQGFIKSATSKNIYKINQRAPLRFIVDDDMIIFNICGPQNAYNLRTKEWECYGYDYDEHVAFGTQVYTGIQGSTGAWHIPTANYYMASYANGIQSLTVDKCSSAINNPYKGYCNTYSELSSLIFKQRQVDTNYSYIYAESDKGIQAYKGTALTSVAYWGLIGSSTNTSKFSTFIGTTAYDDTDNQSIYPMQITSKLLPSYSNHDISVSLDKAYLLYYYNGLKHYTYQSSKIYENIKATFSIRGIQYAVVYDTIYDLSSYTPIVSVLHMKFIGANTSTAYFYSYQDGAIYTFDGNITISYLMPQDAIGDVNDFIYNTGNGALIIAADNGLTVINSNTEQHFIPEDISTTQLYLSDNSVFAYNGTNTNVYSESDSTVGDVLPLDVSTCYYKNAGQKIVNTDCFYIKLYSVSPTQGTVSCSASFLLDKLSTTSTQTYDIKVSDWKDSPYISLRYQPKYNLNDGIALNITSDFPILSIEAGVTQTTTNGVTRINI